MPEPHAPILQYTAAARVPVITLNCLLPLQAAFVSFLNVNLTMCMCGFQDFTSLPGNLIGSTFALITFFTLKARLDRVASCLACVFCLLILAANIHNILWSGHRPVFTP